MEGSIPQLEVCRTPRNDIPLHIKKTVPCQRLSREGAEVSLVPSFARVWNGASCLFLAKNFVVV
jgi:hypothetical protein